MTSSLKIAASACDDYKTRMTTHELGHALGLGHSPDGNMMADEVEDGSDSIENLDRFIYHSLWSY